MKHRLWVLLLLLLSACQIVGQDDVQETVEAGDGLLQAQASALAETADTRRTEAVGTVDIAETRIADIQSVNRQLQATIAAGSTPTISLIAGQVDPPPGTELAEMEQVTGEGSFIKTGITDTINSANGCVVDPRTSFVQSNIEQLYATIQAFNVQAGTPMRAEWYREGELITRDDWAVDQTAQEYCIWFNIDRQDTNFEPGNWSVALYANGVQLQEPMNFTITGG